MTDWDKAAVVSIAVAQQPPRAHGGVAAADIRAVSDLTQCTEQEAAWYLARAGRRTRQRYCDRPLCSAPDRPACRRKCRRGCRGLLHRSDGIRDDAGIVGAAPPGVGRCGRSAAVHRVRRATRRPRCTVDEPDHRGSLTLGSRAGDRRHCRRKRSVPAGYFYRLFSNANGDACAGADDNRVKIWQPGSWRCVRTLAGHTDDVTSLVFLPNGLLVSGSCDNTAKVRDCAARCWLVSSCCSSAYGCGTCPCATR